jgi:hypothetical protein
MKAWKRGSGWAVAGLVVAAVVWVGVCAGCRGAGEVVSAEGSATCPMCGAQTRTVPVKGVTYTKMVCPSCKAEMGSVWDGYYKLRSEVQVCDNCRAVVGKCEACSAK